MNADRLRRREGGDVADQRRSEWDYVVASERVLRDDAGMEKLVPFLRALGEIGCHFSLGYYTRADWRPAAITVHVAASANERWEVEFFQDDSVEIERFVSGGGDDADVDALLAELRDKAQAGPQQQPRAASSVDPASGEGGAGE